MAVDTNLIKGAYHANQPVVTKSGSADGLMIMGDKISQGELDRKREDEEKTKTLSEQIEQQTNKASEEFDKLTNTYMNEGDLSQELHDKTYDYTSALKPVYAEADINGDEKKKSQIKNQVLKIGSQYDILDEIQDSLVGNNPNKSVSTFFTNTELGKQMLSACTNKSESVSFGDNGMEIKVGNTKMSIEEFQALVNKTAYKDTSFEKFINKKFDALSVEQSNFDGVLRESTPKNLEALIRKQVTSSGNLNSLIYDAVIGGTSLYKDLFDDLKTKNYADLGITSDMLSDAKIKPTDKIDPDDVIRLLEELKNSKEGKEVIVQYYTNSLLQNFNLSPTVSNNNDNNIATVRTEEESGFTMFDPNK